MRDDGIVESRLDVRLAFRFDFVLLFLAKELFLSQVLQEPILFQHALRGYVSLALKQELA